MKAERLNTIAHETDIYVNILDLTLFTENRFYVEKQKRSIGQIART